MIKVAKMWKPTPVFAHHPLQMGHNVEISHHSFECQIKKKTSKRGFYMDFEAYEGSNLSHFMPFP